MTNFLQKNVLPFIKRKPHRDFAWAAFILFEMRGLNKWHKSKKKNQLDQPMLTWNPTFFWVNIHTKSNLAEEACLDKQHFLKNQISTVDDIINKNLTVIFCIIENRATFLFIICHDTDDLINLIRTIMIR